MLLLRRARQLCQNLHHAIFLLFGEYAHESCQLRVTTFALAGVWARKGLAVPPGFPRYLIAVLALPFTSLACLAQQPPAPHGSFPGANSVAAHHVRLEGSERPEFYWSVIREAQSLCREGLRIPVELPPPDTILVRLTSDVYYTETHLIEFEAKTKTFINGQCRLEVETQEAIKVTHPFGVCNLDPARRRARGQCAARYAGRPLRANNPAVMGQAGLRQLGTDPRLSCHQYQWDVFDNQSTVCIQTTTESWRSLSARGSGAFEGLWVAHRIQNTAASGETMFESRATSVERNIRVSRDLLDIAGTQGYEIREVGGPPR
jgi:hypothetical protein